MQKMRLLAKNMRKIWEICKKIRAPYAPPSLRSENNKSQVNKWPFFLAVFGTFGLISYHGQLDRFGGGGNFDHFRPFFKKIKLATFNRVMTSAETKKILSTKWLDCWFWKFWHPSITCWVLALVWLLCTCVTQPETYLNEKCLEHTKLTLRRGLGI